MDNGARFIQTIAFSLTATKGSNSPVKLIATLLRTNYFARRLQALQELKRKIRAFGLRQGESCFKELILRHAHHLIVANAARLMQDGRLNTRSG